MQNNSREIIQSLTDHWLHNVLFTANWWILLITTVGAMIVWLIVLDKKRVVEIFLYGMIVAIISTMLDVTGVVLQLWDYPYTLTPLPVIHEVNTIQLPIIFMIIYQYLDKWQAFLIATITNSFVFAFMLEPILIWLHIYKPFHWEHIYSFVIYSIIAIIFKWLVQQFKQLDDHYQK